MYRNHKMEIWKPIEGHSEYMISSLGRVKSTKRKNDIILSPSKKNNGYLQVSLCNNDMTHYISIHRLVGLHFIPNPDNKPHIDHINHDKEDNTVNNLRWVTVSENAINKSTKSKINEKNIRLSYNNHFRVTIKRNYVYVFDKTYKTLEDAIENRDNFLKNYKDENM